MNQTNAAVPLHRIPLSVLKKAPDAPDGFAEAFDKSFRKNRERHPDFAQIVRFSDTPDFWQKAVPVPNVPGFSVAFGPPNSRRFAICEDETATIVGGMASGTILVLPEFRGKGLASEALILAYEKDTVNEQTMKWSFMSEAGRANRASAHRKAVMRAIEQGLGVPDEVLADYPELATPTP